MEPLRVLIADDHPLFREGLRTVLEATDDLQVVAEAADGAEAVRLAVGDRVDVALFDVHMPVLDGIQATRRIRAEQPETQVLVLSTYAEDSELLPALEAGALGYLTKDASAEDIHRALMDVTQGRTHLDPEIQQRLAADAVTRRARGTPDDRTQTSNLTAREIEVLQLIARGLSNTEIAGTLVLSNATVKTHVNHIFAKTGARDRAQAVRYAYQHGIA